MRAEVVLYTWAPAEGRRNNRRSAPPPLPFRNKNKIWGPFFYRGICHYVDCGGYLSLHGGLFHHVGKGPFYSLWGGGAFFKAAIPPLLHSCKNFCGCSWLYNMYISLQRTTTYTIVTWSSIIAGVTFNESLNYRVLWLNILQVKV